MQLDAGAHFSIAGATPAATLDAILAAGWGPADWTACCVVPPGRELFQWQLLPLDPAGLGALAEAKLSAGEAFAAQLSWRDSGVGGTFLLLPDSLVFAPQSNRVKLGERWTDVSWYLQRLQPIFALGSSPVPGPFRWVENLG